MTEKDSKKMKVITQKDYLKRYLSSGKKKKEKIKIIKRVQIIDDNIDYDNNFDVNGISEIDQVDEYAPQIVGVIDERPQNIKILDTYKNKKRWKRIGEDSDPEDNSTKINSNQINNYVQQINKSTLNDLINKKDVEEDSLPIRRDRKTGKIRDRKEEKIEEDNKNKLLKEHKEKYFIWGKGIKQVNDAIEKYQSDLHEMQKPLARYKDDQDLENLLKSKVRDGDPMLEYITMQNKGTDDDSPDRVIHEIREFRGSCPPNRFGIRPGHKWDGVDRSNGYEGKLLLQQNSQKSLEHESYRWSCSDM